MANTISVLMTRYSDLLSRLVYCLTGRGYTHVSISLGCGAPYYSFNFKGFCRETLEKHRRRGVTDSLELQLEIPDTAFRGIQRKLRLMEAFAPRYHYSRLGVCCALLHLPFRWRRHYFCSQFVAELLSASGALKLEKPACLYLPQPLLRELIGQPNLVAVQENII